MNNHRNIHSLLCFAWLWLYHQYLVDSYVNHIRQGVYHVCKLWFYVIKKVVGQRIKWIQTFIFDKYRETFDVQNLTDYGKQFVVGEF